MKAIHVFYIAVILLSVCLLGSASNDSPQDLVLKSELSDTRNLSVADIPGTTFLWETEVTEVVPVPVSVGDVVKWEWSADPEPINDFKVFTRAKPFYRRSGVLNNSGTHVMQKEDYIFRYRYIESTEVGFNWYFQLHHGEHFTKKTTLRYHIEVYEAPKKTPSFQAVYAVAGIILVSYLIIRKKNREESCK